MAKGKLVKISGGKNDLSVVINQELTEYSESVKERLAEAARLSMNKLISLTYDRAPFRDKNIWNEHYRDFITAKKAESRGVVSYIWYVFGEKSRLTHLLSHGHRKRGGSGERTRKNDYLTKSVKEVEREYVLRVEEALRNGK